MVLPIHLESRIDASGIQQLLNTTQSLEPKAVGIQVLAMTALSILTILTFNILRPNNKVWPSSLSPHLSPNLTVLQIVYEPKIKYHAPDKHPPRVTGSFCGWVTPLLHNHEPELFDKDVHGPRLYAHIVSVYLITFFLAALVHHHWRIMYKLRNRRFRSPEYQRLFYARTLYITNIPERRQSDAGLYKIFTGMQLPYPVTSVHIGRSVGALQGLIDKHNKLVEEFEEVLVRYLSGGNPRNQRPMITIGGCCGLGGRRQDAIKYYTTKLKQTEAAVQQCRAQLDMLQAENYGFATISSIPLAHAAAHDLRGRHPKGLTIKLAPNPKDIVYMETYGAIKKKSDIQKSNWLHPVTNILLPQPCSSFSDRFSCQSRCDRSLRLYPFYTKWSIASPATYSLVSGLLPPTVAAIFGSFLPGLMRWLSKYMGATTYSSLDRIVIARYFAFLFVSQLIFFTVIGVLFNSVLEIIIAIQNEGASLKTILDNLDKLPAKLTTTYISQSSFWLKWFPLRGFLIIFDLAQVFSLIYLSFKTRIFGRTPRDIREWTKPPVFGYAIHYSNLLFMGLIGLLFAPVAPLVSLAAAVVFWLCSWVYKYQLMFKFVTRVETGGRCWNVVINRLLFGGMFMQVVMIFTIGLQVQFKTLQFLATIPPLPFMLLFKHYINKKFANDFQYYIPRHEELSRSIVHSEDADIAGNKLEQRYAHPALQAELFTPMVHTRMLPVLRRIYKGKISGGEAFLTRGISKKSGKETDVKTEEVIEGVALTPINENELEYDPMLYRRDREEVDCDFDSVNETSSEDGHPSSLNPGVAHGHPHGGPTVHWESGHETYQFELPPISGSPPPEYVGTLRGVSNRQHDRRPSSLSTTPLYQPSSPPSPGHDANNARVHHHRGRTSGQPEQVHRVKRSSRDRQPVHHGTQDDVITLMHLGNNTLLPYAFHDPLLRAIEVTVKSLIHKPDKCISHLQDIITDQNHTTMKPTYLVLRTMTSRSRSWFNVIYY
ncbi:hypothetical protein BDZ97DRAFT_1916530 [Flammula alnicola]|nr:hypothetical protein BDZ97DRAFT_1916530 [Flammula alnicola]